MRPQSLTIVVVISILFLYYLISPFLSNLDYYNKKLTGTECEAEVTKACLFKVPFLCFEYVSECSVPEGWYVVDKYSYKPVFENADDGEL